MTKKIGVVMLRLKIKPLQGRGGYALYLDLPLLKSTSGQNFFAL